MTSCPLCVQRLRLSPRSWPTIRMVSACLLVFERPATEHLDALTSYRVAEYVTTRQKAKGKGGQLLQVASLNRELQVLRSMFHLAQE